VHHIILYRVGQKNRTVFDSW